MKSFRMAQSFPLFHTRAAQMDARDRNQRLVLYVSSVKARLNRHRPGASNLRGRHTLHCLSLAVPLMGAASAHAQAAAPDQAPGTPQTAAPATVSAPTAPTPQDVQGGIVTGIVTAATAPDNNGKKPAGTPLPGVTVTATNTLTGRKYSAATDISGSFRMAIPRNGRYVLRTDFAAFAPATSEVLLSATQHEGKAEFALELASRVAARAQQEAGSTAALAALAGGNTQALGRGSAVTAGQRQRRCEHRRRLCRRGCGGYGTAQPGEPWSCRQQRLRLCRDQRPGGNKQRPGGIQRRRGARAHTRRDRRCAA